MIPKYPRLPNVHTGFYSTWTGNGSWNSANGRVYTQLGSYYSSVKTPNWGSLSRVDRAKVKNPYANYVERMFYNPGVFSFRTWADAGQEGYIYQGTPPAALQSATTDAKAKALAKVQGRISRLAVNLAQTMAERKQAVDMISKRVNQLIVLARLAKRGDIKRINGYLRDSLGRSLPGGSNAFRGTGRKSSDVAGTWLEIQYGWRPLLSDIYGSCELIADTYHRKYPTVFSAVATAETPLYGKTQFSVFDAVCDIVWRGSMLERGRYVIEVVEDDALALALGKTGISNPALLAWELVPWSFVIDWFVPVGNYLEQLEYARGLRFVRGTYGRRFERRAVGTAENPRLPNIEGKIYACRAEAVFLSEGKSREVLTSFPYGPLPTFEPKLGVERALNGIALLTQLLSGRKVWRH